MAQAIESPFPQFFDTDGKPLDAGSLYFGIENQNPETNPIQVYWDMALTQPAPQPIRTMNGFAVRVGTPALVYANSNYSITVKNKVGIVVYYAASSAAFSVAANAIAIVSQIQSDLSNQTDPAKGAGLLAYNPTLAYQAGTVGDRLAHQIYAEDYPWLCKGDDLTDNTSALLALKAYAATKLPCTINFGKGVFRYTNIGNWAMQGLSLKGQGKRETILRCTNANDNHTAFLMDAFASGSASDPFITANVESLSIQGNPKSGIVVLGQGITRSNWDLNVREAEPTGGIGFNLKGFMLNKAELTCSTDIQGMSSVPYEGLRMEAGSRAGISVGNSSNNFMPSLRMVGLKIGSRFAGADQNVMLGGACESNTVYGCLIGGNSRYNTFIGQGFENPASTSAALSDGGISTKFINCYSDKTVLLQGSSSEINGGYWERIEIQSGAVKNTVKGVRLNNWRTGNGGFYDSGTASEWKNLRGTTFTASFSGTQMTVSGVQQGVLAVGQEIFASGVTTGTTIASLGTGTGGTGTYNLSASVGTLASRAVSSSGFVYPFASRTGITVSGSPFTWQNLTGQYVEIILQAGAVTQIRILRDTDNWLAPINIPGCHLLAPMDKIEISYSSAPTMSYLPHNGFQG